MNVSTRFIRNVLVSSLIFGLSAWGQSTPPQARRSLADSPNLQEMKNYHLTMDKVDKFAVASQNLQSLAKKDPSMKSAMGRDGGAKTIDEGAKRMESQYPAAAAVIQKAGLNVREYLVMAMTLVTTTMVAGMKKQGQSLEHLPVSVSPENLAFVEQNYPKIEKLLKSLSQTDEKE